MRKIFFNIAAEDEENPRHFSPLVRRIIKSQDVKEEADVKSDVLSKGKPHTGLVWWKSRIPSLFLAKREDIKEKKKKKRKRTQEAPERRDWLAGSDPCLTEVIFYASVSRTFLPLQDSVNRRGKKERRQFKLFKSMRR